MIITLGENNSNPPQKKKMRDPNDLRLASVDELLQTAARVVKAAEQESQLFDSKKEAELPSFSDREISTGHILGRGGFCIVRSVDKIRTLKQRRGSFKSEMSGRSGRSLAISEAGQSASSRSKRGGIFSLCFRRGGDDDTSTGFRDSSRVSLDSSAHSNAGSVKELSSEAHDRSRDDVASRSRKSRNCYVLKSVSKDVDKLNYMKGSVDIAMEAKFLAAVSHPNIINLVAVSKSEPCTTGYFLVLEKMNETLTGKIKSWMDKDRQNKGFLRSVTGGKKKDQELYRERMAASYDIASGLFYLHSKNVVFRDLKPDNVGFDARGTLKLFDFGLAKELKEADLRDDGTYRNMTAMTGAIRYMAPEVGLHQPYNRSVDVYSWSMVMWFILALEPPFGFYTEDMMRSRVHRKGSRPSIFRRWNDVIGEILRCAWDADPNERPNFLEITLVLKQELIDCEVGGTVTGSAMDTSDRDDEERSQTSRKSRPSQREVSKQ